MTQHDGSSHRAKSQIPKAVTSHRTPKNSNSKNRHEVADNDGQSHYYGEV